MHKNLCLHPYTNTLIHTPLHIFPYTYTSEVPLLNFNRYRQTILLQDLERIFCCLGLSPSTDDVHELIAEIDPRKTGKLEFNAFISHVVPYLREGYEQYLHASLGHTHSHSIHYQYALLTNITAHPLNVSYQPSLLTDACNPHSQSTLSTHPINQPTLSTHPINPFSRQAY